MFNLKDTYMLVTHVSNISTDYNVYIVNSSGLT